MLGPGFEEKQQSPMVFVQIGLVVVLGAGFTKATTEEGTLKIIYRMISDSKPERYSVRQTQCGCSYFEA